MPLLIQELSEFKLEWNTHRIRFDAKSRCPSGCPDDNYFLPELNNTNNFGFNVNEEDYNYIYNKYCNNSNLGEYITIQRQFELSNQGVILKKLEDVESASRSWLEEVHNYNIFENHEN